MARQSYYTDPARKELGVFQDFSGGLNTTTAHDNLADNELTRIVNMSFDERGAISRRTGMSLFKESPVPLVNEEQLAQYSQMYFRFYRTPVLFDEIVAVDGTIYVNGEQKVTNLQSERMMEAVQWYGDAFIATGSGLYKWDGTTLAPVEAYKPKPLEALYVGTNAIAENPNNYIDDGEGPSVQLVGAQFDKRYGIVNEPYTLTAFHSKPAGSTLEYKFEYRYPFEPDGVYHIGQDWSTSKTYTAEGEGEGDIQFRITARRVGQTIAEATELIPKYTIKPNADPDDIQPNLSAINSCNRIILHWERLIIYGDETNINTVYISHLKNPYYFPIPNTLFFESTTTEAVNTIVRFRDHLVAFTDSTIQALFGKAPSDYRRVVLNTSTGCIAPRGAVVMDNYIAFLSADGIYYLKSIGYVDDKANVASLDLKIRNMIPLNARDASLVMYNDQLHATFPNTKQRFRFYKNLNIWTYDESPRLDVNGSIVYNNNLYHLLKNGTINVEDLDSYRDSGYIYPAIYETKYLDFGLPYHPKKLKEVQLLARSFEEGQVARVKTFLDGLQRTDDPVEWQATLVPADEYNTFIDKFRVSGKALRMKMQVEHNLDSYIQFLGFSVIFKLKKP